MPDNTVLNAGSGGDTIRDVAKNSIKTPVCILDIGGAGAESLLAAGQAAKANSLPVTLASDQGALAVSGTVAVSGLPALPAGANLVGQVAGAQQIGILYNGTTPVTVQQVAVNCASSGSNQLVAAVVGQKVRVHKFLFVVGGGVSLTVADGSTPLTGAMPLVANQILSGAEGPLPHFTGGTGNALNLVLSSAVQVSGYLLYAQY